MVHSLPFHNIYGTNISTCQMHNNKIYVQNKTQISRAVTVFGTEAKNEFFHNRIELKLQVCLTIVMVFVSIDRLSNARCKMCCSGQTKPRISALVCACVHADTH